VAEQFEALLGVFSLIPHWAIYLVIGGGAALENILPPIPSDLMVILGGVLVDRGVVRFTPVLLVAWFSNVALAILVYVGARRYGRGVFSHRWAHWLLRPHQLEQLAVFYSRYGTAAIFLSRFLPVFRVLVPAFAGVSQLGFFRTAIPVAAASAIAYTVLILAGMFASRNVPRLLGIVGHLNTWLLVAAGLAFIGVGIWWWRTRRPRVLQRHEVLEEERERFKREAEASEGA
jgi:membrane protein DedA with SNARE-associated domain